MIKKLGDSKTFLSRKEKEELKKKEDEEAAAQAFQEFVETFEEPPNKLSKVWVKAGTYDAGSRKEDHREKGKLYKPTAKLDYVRNIIGGPSNEDSASGLKKRTQEKKKSNLELFKEELRIRQEGREEYHKYKSVARSLISGELGASEAMAAGIKEPPDAVGSFDNGDPNTTNLYLGNLCPKISEQQLMEQFGKYGPLASIKIMWPRSEEEKSRGRNCGFVAYMSRKDAERALRQLNGRFVMGYEMKLGWGKSVPIMSHPIYIPPALVAYSTPTASGLPFNAQPPSNDDEISLDEKDLKNYTLDENAEAEVDKVLSKCLIKVVIPTERGQLALIHRMIEFVIREGPLFEAMIMNREVDNPAFRFLFDNNSTGHIYYRWKLFSLLQGDTISEWRQKEFRMFLGGSVWKPPVANFYTQGMPDELVDDEEFVDNNKGALSVAQRDRLEDLIRHLTPERQKIGDAMIFCIEHADAADEISECIAQSMESGDTLMHKKIARLYLISDILHNCSVKVQNASFFRKALENSLVKIFTSLNRYYMAIESRIKAEGFKARVMQVFRAWEEWAVYPREFLGRLKHIFMGLQSGSAKSEEIDGAPLSGDDKDDEDLDGVPLDGAALLKSAMLRGLTEASSSTPQARRLQQPDSDGDIDGVPLDLDEDIDGVPLDGVAGMPSGGFIPSKWETVAPDQIEAQAVTSSKWETTIASQRSLARDSSDDSSSPTHSISTKSEYDEDKRAKLREVELKTIQYQDELESGERPLKSGWTISRQLEHYRRRLMKKSLIELRQGSVDSDPREKRSVSPENKLKRTNAKRSPSPAHYSKRSRRGRSRSLSPAEVRTSSSSSSFRKNRSPLPVARKRSPRRSRSPSSRHRLDKHKYK